MTADMPRRGVKKRKLPNRFFSPRRRGLGWHKKAKLRSKIRQIAVGHRWYTPHPQSYIGQDENQISPRSLVPSSIERSPGPALRGRA
jgi:hypothetical protein